MNTFVRLGISVLIILIALMLMYSIQWAFSLGGRVQAQITWGIGLIALVALVVCWVTKPPVWMIFVVLALGVGLFLALGGAF